MLVVVRWDGGMEGDLDLSGEMRGLVRDVFRDAGA
jgi:hypothetical protein